MIDYIEIERKVEIKREKAIDRILANGLEIRSASWQTINYGAAEVAYCSMDTIYETMAYTLIGERYE